MLPINSRGCDPALEHDLPRAAAVKDDCPSSYLLPIAPQSETCAHLPLCVGILSVLSLRQSGACVRSVKHCFPGSPLSRPLTLPTPSSTVIPKPLEEQVWDSFQEKGFDTIHFPQKVQSCSALKMKCWHTLHMCTHRWFVCYTNQFQRTQIVWFHIWRELR